jgi:hypothetical protein
LRRKAQERTRKDAKATPKRGGRPRAGTRTQEGPSSSSLFEMGSMESLLEKQAEGESPVLSSHWERSPNTPPPSIAVPIHKNHVRK